MLDFRQALGSRIVIGVDFDIVLRFLNSFIPILLLSRIFIVFAFLMVLFGSSKIVSLFIENKWIVFIVSTFSILNPAFYGRFGLGHVPIILGIGFSLFSVGYLLEYFISDTKIKLLCNLFDYRLVLFGLFFALSITASPHFVFLNILFYILFLVGYFLKCNHNKNMMFFIVHNVLNVFMVLFFNANFIFGTIFSTTNINGFINNIDKVYAVVRGNNIFDTIFYSLNTCNSAMDIVSTYYNSLITKYPSVLFIISFFVIFSIFIYGIIESLKNKTFKKYKFLFIFLLFIFFVSIILNIGYSTKFTGIFSKIMYNYVPFYKGMRESTKWFIVTNIIYLIFISIGVKNLYNLIGKNIYKKIFFGIVLFGFIFLRAPYVMFGMWGQLKVINYPNDFAETNNYLKNVLKCDGEILSLPYKDYLNFRFIGNKRSNDTYNFLSDYFDCNVIVGNSNEAFTVYNKNDQDRNNDIYLMINKKDLDVEALKKYNIKYVLLGKFDDYLTYYNLLNNKFELIKDFDHFELYKIK